MPIAPVITSTSSSASGRQACCTTPTRSGWRSEGRTRAGDAGGSRLAISFTRLLQGIEGGSGQIGGGARPLSVHHAAEPARNPWAREAGADSAWCEDGTRPLGEWG